MILPRYSIRWLLGLTALCALFFLCLSLAVDGHTWAVAIVAPGLGLILLAALYLIAFSLAYLGGTLLKATRKGQGGSSPFGSRQVTVESADPPPADAVPTSPFAPPAGEGTT